MIDPNSPSPKTLHPQTMGKNKLNNPPPLPKTDSTPAPTVKGEPSTAVPAASIPVIPEPGKDRSFYEITVKVNDSDAPPFVVEVSLSGNGPNDQARAREKAKAKHPGKAMTILSSRIYTRTANALSEINPVSTLSMLFTSSGATEDLIEIGHAFFDGSRGALFLRNMRSHVGLTFRPTTGGLVVFNNRIVSNRLASELPVIVAEILGNGAREIELFLK